MSTDLLLELSQAVQVMIKSGLASFHDRGMPSIIRIILFDSILNIFFAFNDIAFVFKVEKGQRYRFSLIVNELKDADLAQYQTVCVSFINALLFTSDDFHERVRLRNEFIGNYSKLCFVLDEIHQKR